MKKTFIRLFELESLLPDEDKEWYKKNINVKSKGYNNGHEWFSITGIDKKYFPNIIKALQEAENNGLYSYKTKMDIRQGYLILECNTAKDYNQDLLNIIIKSINNEYYATYWQDCWDYPSNIEIESVEKCECTEFAIEPTYNEPTYYDVTLCIEDKQSGVIFDIGGGCIHVDQVDSFYDLAKSIPKSSDYKENIVDYEYEPERE